jgi:hypothetical protein
MRGCVVLSSRCPRGQARILLASSIVGLNSIQSASGSKSASLDLTTRHGNRASHDLIVIRPTGAQGILVFLGSHFLC